MERLNNLLPQIEPVSGATSVEKEVEKFNAVEKPSEIACERCKGKGVYAITRTNENGSYMVLIRCQCNDKREKLQRMKRSGLESVISAFTWSSFTPESRWQEIVKSRAKEYAKSDPLGWFFIGGQSGAGKSHICTAICRDLFGKAYEIKYMLWREEARKLKATINDPYYGETVDFLKSVDVLYIDDLFKTSGTVSDAEISLAFEILNARYMSNKPTIISSEKTLEMILEIDEAIAGRIKEKCGKFVISIDKDPKKNYRFRDKGDRL